MGRHRSEDAMESIHILSSENRGWLQDIRSRQVYDARVRSYSTDGLVLVTFSRPDRIRSIALYSLRDKSWSELPPIPDLDGVIPPCCQSVSLEGMVYVLGGGTQDLGDPSSDAVYVFDIAGQRPWKECASMSEARARFECGVTDGKIYVFGGVSSYDPVQGTEVYDQKENTWSLVKPMISLRCSHRVTVVREELFLHDGWILDRDYFHATPKNSLMHSFTDDVEYIIPKVDCVNVYHPGTDEWRQLRPFGRGAQDVLFASQGKFYSIGQFDTHVLDDVNENSWTPSPSYAFRDAVEWPSIVPYAFLAVDDELLAIVCLQDIFRRTEEFCLVQSRGFKSGNGVIVWQSVQFPHFFGDCHRWYKLDLNYPIQL